MAMRRVKDPVSGNLSTNITAKMQLSPNYAFDSERKPMTNSIPNQFHFVYGLKKQRKPFPLYHYICLKSCDVINQPEKILSIRR